MIITQKYLKLLSNLLAIPAVSRQEKERADMLEGWLKREGLSVRRLMNNLIVSGSIDPVKAKILLNSHIDTVPAGDHWKTDPNIPVRSEGKITALGSNDAGASVIALIAAFMEINRIVPGHDIVLVLSAEEEISGRNGISSVLPLLGDITFGIIGEPTGMRPAVAERGLMVIDAVADGEAGHAARNEGRNAIYAAMEDIQKLRKMKFPRKSKWLESPSVQVTMIHAGKVHNVVPGNCEFVMDVRSNDMYSNYDLLDLLQASTDSTLKPRSMRLNSSSLAEDHPAFSVIETLNLHPIGSPTLSDMALLDIPAIKMGPGESSRSHTADEFILESELEEGANGYLSFISELLKVNYHSG